MGSGPETGGLERACVALVEALTGRCALLEQGVSLSALTTLAVGGPARIRAVVHETAELLLALEASRDLQVPTVVVGRGSNLLVSDGGYQGLVLQLGGEFERVEIEGDAPEPWRAGHPGARSVWVGGGAWNAHAVKTIHRAGLVGPEFLALIPGALGGAVAMNAGTRWGELSSLLLCVELVSADAGRQEVAVEALEMGYRHCRLPPGAVVVGGRLVAWPGDVEEARERIRAEKAYRSATQPYQERCAGSFFANPPGDAAGRLVEAAGLKGLRYGGAEISGKHANFIVNADGATAAEVVGLMALARRLVGQGTGVWLRPEVRLLGFGPGSAEEVLDGLQLPAALWSAARAHGVPEDVMRKAGKE